MDITPPTSRYEQIADEMRKKIIDGTYPPESKLPSESTIVAQTGVTRPTVNRAYRLLAAEGLVEIKHGSGTFVRARRPVILQAASYVTKTGDGQRAVWSSEMDRQGMVGTQKIVQVATVRPPADIAGWLGLTGDEDAVLRDRHMSVDGELVQLARSYYRATLAGGTELAGTKKMKGGTVAALERLGVTFSTFEEIISARMPTAEEARLLRLGPGVPVVRHIRITRDQNGEPVEVSEAICNADRHVFSFHLPATMP